MQAESEIVPTISVNVAKLYEKWQRSQRDHNIHRPAVEDYKKAMTEGRPIKPISFETLVFDDASGDMFVRTLDGRHRLTAAYELGRQTIEVLATDLAMHVKFMLDL